MLSVAPRKAVPESLESNIFGAASGGGGNSCLNTPLPLIKPCRLLRTL
jgi:hypothetical protein